MMRSGVLSLFSPNEVFWENWTVNHLKNRSHGYRWSTTKNVGGRKFPSWFGHFGRFFLNNRNPFLIDIDMAVPRNRCWSQDPVATPNRVFDFFQKKWRVHEGSSPPIAGASPRSDVDLSTWPSSCNLAILKEVPFEGTRTNPDFPEKSPERPEALGESKTKDCEECTNFGVLDNPQLSLSGLWRPDSRRAKLGLKNYSNTNQV